MVKKCKNIVLEDDISAGFGGTSYNGETLGEFLESVGCDIESLEVWEVNEMLKDCGIKPIKSVYPVIDLAIHGRTYAERKADLRKKAIEWQRSEYEWSYAQLVLWNDYFEANGKRYGLLREFRENAIV